MNSHPPFVFIDTETTGLSARTGGRVLEIGALRVEDNKVVAKYKQLLHPETDVPYFITQITGITDQDVESAPTFADIFQDVRELFKDAIFIAHNVNFDYKFLQSEFEKVGEQFKKDRLCTVRLSRKLFPEHKSHSLDKIIERHGFEVENRHRAYDDAEILYKFYSHLQKDRQEDLQKAIEKTMILCKDHS